jgi:putative ABC transport system permease protein
MGRFFDVFAVRPALGRLYRPEDSENGKDRVVVITDALWRSWAGGDPNVIGRTIELDGTSFQVIGVLPAGFRYRPTIQVYTPMVITAQVRAQRGVWGTSALARLRPGVSPAQFTAGLDRISKVWQADPARANDADAHWFLSGKSLVAAMAGELRALLELLMVAVLLVLVIACANVANLQLLRATAREKELAVRAAMGAGKWPIVRQLLMESGLLSLAGGILGLGLGVALIHLLRELGSGPLPALHNVRLDPSVLVFTAAATLCSALLFGVAPALRAARADLQGVLRDTSRNASAGPGRNRLLRTSVAAQMALSLLLLLGAGLLIRSLTQLVKIDPGFQPSHLLTFQVALPRARYAEPPQRAAFFGQLLTRLATQPSIDAVGAISDLPFGQGRNSSPFTIAGKPTAPGEPDRHADMRFVEGDYFKAAGIPLIRGRAFSSLDGDQAVPLSAIIDESLARQYFGSDDPIGQTISQGPSAVIVGVVGAVKHGDLTEADKPTVYYPYHQAPWYSGLYLAVRTRQATDVVVAEAKAAVRELDSTLPIFDVVSMQQRVDDSLGARRVAMLVLTGLAGLALLLALLGIYGVMSYTTSRRTHELGIRLALGAVPGDVVRMVLQEGMMLAGIGLLAGLASFLFLARLLTSILYGVSPRDPFTIAAGIGTLLLGTVVAALLPARRAARVDPMETLREQ